MNATATTLPPLLRRISTVAAWPAKPRDMETVLMDLSTDLRLLSWAVAPHDDSEPSDEVMDGAAWLASYCAAEVEAIKAVLEAHHDEAAA